MDPSDDKDDEPFDFDGHTFDERFVSSAGLRELSATDRVRAAERQRLAEIDKEQRLRKARSANRWHRRLGRRLRPQKKHVGVAVVIALVAGAAWWDFRPSSKTSPFRSGNDTVATKRVASDRPTPKKAQTMAPLGVAPEVERTSSPYRFLNKQPNSDEPVTYDPCRKISVVINDAKAPVGSEGIVNEALDETSRLTGLQFQIEGKSDEVYAPDRQPFQPKRYGDRWAPVLIVWGDEASVPDFAGGIAGRGASDVFSLNANRDVYVSGLLGLDATDGADILRHSDGRAIEKSVVLHELGHVVGLDHVEDSSQLMNPEGRNGVVDFAAGDRAGLARLGKGTCNAEL